MPSVTIFIPKNCKASGATSAIIYGTYQYEKYTCLECTLYSVLPLAIQTTANADIAAANTKRNDIFKRSWRVCLHDISKCYTISFSILRIFPTTFVTMVICLVTFPFPLDVVLSVWAIRDSREMKQNVWKSIEWVFRIIQIGKICFVCSVIRTGKIWRQKSPFVYISGIFHIF